MRERNFIIACLVFIAYLVLIVLALLYSDYSKNKMINKQKEDIERMWETEKLLKNSIDSQWKQLVIQDETINKMINE